MRHSMSLAPAAIALVARSIAAAISEACSTTMETVTIATA
jgi:hypothetical protein